MPAKMLADLCGKLGLPLPEPDALGGYPLTLADGLTPVVTPDRNGVSLAGELLVLPAGEDEKDALCRELLGLSLGRTGQECTISLPRLAIEDNKLLLRQELGTVSTPDDFETALEAFVNLMEKWRSLASKEQGRQTIRAGGGLQSIILP